MPATVFSTMPASVCDGVLARYRAVTVNVLTWSGPGDQASRIILGTANWMRSARTGDPEAVVRAKRVIDDAVVLFGLPGSDELTRSMAFALASACGGIVFDGQAVWDANGSLVASAPG